MRGLEAAAGQALDRRLLRDSSRPLAVALSGGGDSLALTLIADEWARAAGRDLLVFTVDHRLQPESHGWTAACATVATRLGRPFQALAWEGDKPTTGLPAAARRARHRLLAAAAREAGAHVILMGHTADDLAEAEAMRADGATTPDPREWAPSPVWPDGRGLFILRPLLETRRAEIRAWLDARGETWIDDPANIDPRYARSRARLAGAEARTAAAAGPPLALADLATENAGIIALSRAVLRSGRSEDVRRFVALATVSAGGGERLPAAPRTRRVAEALRGSRAFVATLAGARIEADDAQVLIFREAGEIARGGLVVMRLSAGQPAIWDGRFELTAEEPGCEVRRLAGLARRLAPDQQQALRELPAAARAGLPVIVSADGSAACPALEGIASLVGPRLRAAAGLVQREPD